MFPSSFEYQRADSVAEAVALLGKHKDAKLIAGGHSLLPAMKLRLAQPSMLIDISRIKDLQGIRESDGTVAIFALTTHNEVAASSLSPKAMRDAASQIGDMQVRNRGTLGGSISHADPAADYPAVLLALGAHLRAEGPGGSRVILADDFFTDLFTTALKPNEVLIGARFGPRPAGRVGTAYAKHAHPASGFAVTGVSAAVATDAGGKVTMARVAVTGACAKAQHLKATEAALAGKKFDSASIKAAAAADNHLSCLSDSYASADYRAHLSGVLARRALESCLARLA
jgi:carbon-monoxide dehydrogenase medium subunit